MNEKPKRPLVIWATQILLLLFALLFLFILAGNLSAFVDFVNHPPTRLEAGEYRQGIIFYVVLLVFLIGLFGLLPAAFWGLVKRKPYGHWISVAVFAFVWLVMLYAQIFPAKGPLERYEYDNATQQAFGTMAQILLLAIFLLPVLYLAFSKKVRAFFHSSGDLD